MSGSVPADARGLGVTTGWPAAGRAAFSASTAPWPNLAATIASNVCWSKLADSGAVTLTAAGVTATETCSAGAASFDAVVMTRARPSGLVFLGVLGADFLDILPQQEKKNPSTERETKRPSCKDEGLEGTKRARVKGGAVDP